MLEAHPAVADDVTRAASQQAMAAAFAIGQLTGNGGDGTMAITDAGPPGSGHVADTGDVTANAVAKDEVGNCVVSPRTLRRYRARGLVPTAFRTLGRDGKSYADRSPVPPDPLHRDLRMALNAVRRASQADQFRRADLGDLEAVAREASDLLTVWQAEMAVALRARAGSRR